MRNTCKILLPVAAVFWTSCAPSHTPDDTPQAASNPAPRILPTDAMADPLEPVNRGFWVVNRGLLVGVLQPTGRAWRAVVPEPARQSIKHFARNVTYPGRVVNHMLQGRWQGAGDESLRFLTNTTVGVGGFFDVASRWDMPKSDAAFGETFMHWGWRPRTYLMLPVFGPSDETNAVGIAGDRLAEPFNYIDPLQYVSAVTSFNRLSATTDEFVRFAESSADPYADTKIIWTHAVTPGEPDMSLRGPVDISTLETLEMARVRPLNPDFAVQGRRMNVRIDSTGRTMPFNCWLQKQRAPLVYINPGLGGHRLSLSQLSVAEHLYQNGFSVVTTTSSFHPEFMSRASSAKVPAYPPVDRADVLAMIEAIDKELERRHPGLFGERSMVGFSMGGFQALQLAATEGSRPTGSMQFSRYVAINPAIDLHYGVKELDDYALAANQWPQSEREALIDNLFLKVVKLAREAPGPEAGPPFDATESQLLIGLSFRMVLRDIIYSCESRHDLGVLQNPVSKWRRDAVYQEIMAFSYEDYFRKMVLPYYQPQGVALADFKREANLRSYTRGLASNRKARVITNDNDFIKNPSDMSWMNRTFGGGRLTVFPNGGHLGNLGEEKLHDALLKALR
ncbi:MAG: MlaA family lipoprotein [Akkermansiaceae bacterium]|jgi:ABC-type transporter lipoprotein component MlaA|nr:MlaA family lipoprotein [Akkermansiaceae bacterium]MCU0776065.1 MlaA family lipoprotein [Akkermansiaceae bacterium]